MSEYDTFAELKAAIENWTVRSDIPTSVYDLATARINRKLRVREMLSAYSATATAEAVTLPSDFIQFEYIYIDADPRIELVGSDSFSQTVAWRSSGTPTSYHVQGDSLYLNPVPSGSFSLAGTYYAKLAAFADAADTNTVLTTYPEIYHAACMMMFSAWDQDAESIGLWTQAFERLVMEANDASMMARYSGPLKSRPRASA